MHMHAHDIDASSPLGFTGERVIPDDPKWAWCFQAHLFGYNDLVRRTTRGGVMLDCGCGEGYGASVLAKHARTVVTFDVSFDTVQHAKKRYSDPKIQWLVADAQRLPFRDSAFDVTSSLQVIEHFSDTDSHLQDIARVTKPGGMHYVTTPNISKMGEAEKDNPFHLRDFDARDFESSLRKFFGNVRVEGMFYVEDSPRYQRMRKAEAKEDALRPKLQRLEQRISHLPGAVRSRIRPLLRKLAGISEWPLKEAEDARNAILAEDFVSRQPAEESFCLIGVAIKE
ncbi:MAG: class I SAM-dependent methyltransferase [Actinomycetota bacterium]